MLGKTLLLAGAIPILGAVFARAGQMGMNAERIEAGLPVLQTLAEAYPQHATWLVPEGPVGYAISAALVLVGTCLTVLAGDAARHDRHRNR